MMPSRSVNSFPFIHHLALSHSVLPRSYRDMKVSWESTLFVLREFRAEF